MSDATTLPAGRELDARIAEKVLGAMIHEGEYDDYMTLPGERPVSDQRPVPPYSTDIAAAWEVVEKMRRDGYEVAVMCAPGQPATSCEVAKPEWRGSEVWDADTAPLAICRAALAAVEAA